MRRCRSSRLGVEGDARAVCRRTIPKRCVSPTGVPRQAPYPWRILQTPTHMFFLFEGNIHSYRQIFMDGRKHPDRQTSIPTWYGHSIGRFEGDTLVIDTVGLQRQILVRLRRPSAHREAAYHRALPASRLRQAGIRGHHRRSRARTPSRSRSTAATTYDIGHRADGVHLQRKQPGRRAHRRQGPTQQVLEAELVIFDS